MSIWWACLAQQGPSEKFFFFTQQQKSWWGSFIHMSARPGVETRNLEAILKLQFLHASRHFWVFSCQQQHRESDDVSAITIIIMALATWPKSPPCHAIFWAQKLCNCRRRCDRIRSVAFSFRIGFTFRIDSTRGNNLSHVPREKHDTKCIYTTTTIQCNVLAHTLRASIEVYFK